MRRVLDGLPLAHQDTLRLLCGHLSIVAEHAAVNKMTIENLSTIFAPTILCGQSSQNLSMALPQQETYIMQYLIVNARKLFPSLNNQAQVLATANSTGTSPVHTAKS